MKETFLKSVKYIESHKIIKFILSLLFSVFFALCVEKLVYSYESFSIKRFLIITFVLFLLLLPFCLFNHKIVLNFTYHKRYFIGIGLFIILVALGIHGSSVGNYNLHIQPGRPVESAEPLFGTNRAIRSDEWAVSTPVTLSQAYNDFNPESDILNATNKNITFYPKIATKSIFTITNPNTLGYLFLPTEQAFSFAWWFGYFLLFFVSFELIMLFTKKNKFYSLMGAILITFSPANLWWNSWNIITYGELAILLFNKFLKQNKFYKQLLLAIAIGLIGACYIACMYPAWQIPYGYLFLILTIWIIIKNKKNCSIKKFVTLFVVILIMIGVLIIPPFIQSYDAYQLTTHTVYPGARLSTGGKSGYTLLGYFVSIFSSFKEPANASEISQFVSLFPIPIIMGFYYWFQNHKKGKKDFLLVSLTILSTLLCFWNFIPIPEWLSKITLLSMSKPERTVVTVGFICTLLLIYCLSRYQTIKLDGRIKYQNFVIALIIAILGTFVAKTYYNDYFTLDFIIFDLIFFTIIMFLCLNNKDFTNKIAISFLAIVTLVSGICIHPIVRGLDIIYNKPIAKEIQKIEEEEPDAVWLSVDQDFTTSNYMVANGANTLNSVYYYPNPDLWKKLGLENQEDIWNRYAHIVTDISDNSTSLHLDESDKFTLTLNQNDVCLLDIDYILSHNKDLDQFDNNKIDFDKIYDEDYYYIYKINCSE